MLFKVTFRNSCKEERILNETIKIIWLILKFNRSYINLWKICLEKYLPSKIEILIHVFAKRRLDGNYIWSDY